MSMLCNPVTKLSHSEGFFVSMDEVSLTSNNLDSQLAPIRYCVHNMVWSVLGYKQRRH